MLSLKALFFLLAASFMQQRSCGFATIVAQSKIQAMSFKCSNRVKAHFASTQKAPVCSQQHAQTYRNIKSKAANSTLAPSSLLMTPRALFFLSQRKLQPTCCSSLHACTICMCACDSWAGPQARERCLGLIRGHSWRRREGGCRVTTSC